MDQTHIGYKSWDEPRGGNVKPKVTRITPDEAKKGGYVFDEKNRVVVMEGEHYFAVKNNQKTNWTVIPDLGRTLSGIALMPYNESVNGTEIEYKMNFESKTAENVKLRVFFDCTLPFKKGGQSVSASFNGAKEESWNINDQLTWQNNYSKMYPAGAARMIETTVTLELPKNTNDGSHTLKIKPLDPGIVIYKVIVDFGGFEETHLKMPESQYKKQ